MIQNEIRKITKIKPTFSTTGGTSDARFIRKFCPVMEFGVVGKTMHKLNEHVDIPIISEKTEAKILNAIYDSIEDVVKEVMLEKL